MKFGISAGKMRSRETIMRGWKPPPSS
jgi:hypothetical protein